MPYNPSKTTWFNPDIEYLFNNEIIEYDMKDAGFNIIKQFKLLPDIKIKELELIGKGFERHKQIGILQRNDKEFSKRLSDKFAEMRGIFIATNNISDNNIISVKKDAIFTIGYYQRLNFGQIEFIPKNHYTSYIRFTDIQNLEIYYSDNKIDIKGMSDISANRHRLYMIEFLKRIIDMIESNNLQAKRYIMKFIDDYKYQNIDPMFYLEFNNKSISIDPIFNYKHIILPLVQIILKEVK